MTFQEWVDKSGGALSVSKRLGVSRAIVYMWCRRVNPPKLKNIIDILHMAEGQLTFWDIVNSTMAYRREPLKAASAKKRGRSNA